MIEIKYLTKYFGRRPVLQNLELTIYRRERFALMGANGSGKSTLLRILSTLVKPTRGKIYLGGFDASQKGEKIRNFLGVVGHQTYLYPDLSARENLLFFARLFNVKDVQKRVDELLRGVGLFPRALDPVSTFSRGMSQRLAVARALLHRPAILLLDEPYTGLDKEAEILLEELLSEFCQAGGTVLFATHSHEKAMKMGNRIGELVNGSLHGGSFNV